MRAKLRIEAGPRVFCQIIRFAMFVYPSWVSIHDYLMRGTNQSKNQQLKGL